MSPLPAPPARHPVRMAVCAALLLLGAGPGLRAERAEAADPAPLPRLAAAAGPEDAGEAEGAGGTADPAEADLFALPLIAGQTRAAIGEIQAGNLDGAAEILDALVAAHPGIGRVHADQAVARMLRGDAEGAIEALGAAAALGFDGLAEVAADPLFAGIAGDPRLRALLPAGAPPAVAAEGAPAVPAEAAEFPPMTAVARPLPRPPSPLARVTAEGVALVSGANTVWDPVSERLRAGFVFPDAARGAMVPDRGTAATDILREHAKRGRAAGNLGDLYDNRDRGHSALDPKDHPQLARTAYSGAARAADVDYGLNEVMRFDAPTFGNSSTAITGDALWRSLPRLALTRADGTGPARLWQDASANALYVYPAHKDYGRESGDLFPANTPYILVSHGSSGSDKPFLEALAMILAAYRPETKARLVAENLIVPVTQMVFRRSLQNVRSRADYLGAAAHPAAFNGYDINLARMVSLANSIRAGDIPPQVRIRVTAEDEATEGVDYFGEGLTEQLFDTPGAVARIWRSSAFSREITLDAGATEDPNGRALRFEWRLLQGDPARVRITPSEDGLSAKIGLDWQEPFAISKDNPVVSARVDIGVFANNGVHDSAPAILSVYFPPEEARIYAAGPDGLPRIASIDYASRPGVYADPMLIARPDWRDAYHYDAAGKPTGWTRVRGAGAAAVTEDFDAAGRRLGSGAPERVVYPPRRLPDGGLVLDEVTAPPP